jgi:ribosomal RNA-processing protein 8
MGKNKNKSKANEGHKDHHGQRSDVKNLPVKSTHGAKRSSAQKTSGLASGGKLNGGGKLKGLSALQQKFAKKLEGSRFRVINEKLYTTNGAEAFTDFTKDPSLFDVYHEGFREQASHWPENPLDGIIHWIKKKHPRAVVADMGCGDARLAASVGNKVHSFDLVSRNPKVVACDIAHVPLSDESTDVVVFCLALMGTNIADFLKESHRILKVGGMLRIAEVRSRFEGEGDGVKKFLRILKKCGFDLCAIEGQGRGQGNGPAEHDDKNKMFFEVEARKSTRSIEPRLEYTAKACIYKRR